MPKQKRWEAKLPPLSVSKKSTRFWTGMPLARKSKIFGLRSIPANTTPVSLKNRYILRFFAYKVFFRRACQRKNGKCSITDERVDFEVYRQTETAEIAVFLFGYYLIKAHAVCRALLRAVRTLPYRGIYQPLRSPQNI